MEKPAGSRHQIYHLRHLTLSGLIEYVWEQVQSWARVGKKSIAIRFLILPFSFKLLLSSSKRTIPNLLGSSSKAVFEPRPETRREEFAL